jgi:hypothetical protein
MNTVMLDQRRSRPIGVTYLALFLFILAIWNGLRLGETIFFWKTLKGYGANPIYMSASSGVWLIIGLFLVWGLWQGKNWGRMAVICGSAAYTAWYWFDRLALQAPQANWLFVLSLNIVLILLFFGILFSKQTSQFFKRVGNERQSETPTTS